MDFGIAAVGAITALAYIIGMLIKASGLPDKWIPVCCGVVGVALGLLSYALGLNDFPANDPITAAAVGGVSGLAATGIHQTVKQLGKN